MDDEPGAGAPLVRSVSESDFFRSEDVGLHGQPDDGHACRLIASEFGRGMRLGIGLNRLQPGERHLLHHHPSNAEFYYITRGASLVTAGAEEVWATVGTAFYFPPGTPHAVHNTSGEICEFLYGFDSADLAGIEMVFHE